MFSHMFTVNLQIDPYLLLFVYISPNKDHDYQFIASANRVFTAQETDKRDYRTYDVILRRKHAQDISFNFLCVTVLLKLCKNR